MKHHQLRHCQSTQLFLKELNPSDDSPLLVSCLEQDGGFGRENRKWNKIENALAFSFVLTPNEEWTLTSLEVGVLLVRYIKLVNNEIKIQLKWPNDLTKEGKKVGGILCQGQSQLILVGVGLNWGRSTTIESNTEYKIGRDCLFSDITLTENDYHRIPYDIYHYILQNRLTAGMVRTVWTNYCGHMNRKLTIKTDKEFTGIFRGIGEKGQALVENDFTIKEIFSGEIV